MNNYKLKIMKETQSLAFYYIRYTGRLLVGCGILVTRVTAWAIEYSPVSSAPRRWCPFHLLG